jgi:hypothetical protein
MHAVKRKKKDGSSVNVKCQESVKLYNANMGGVDNANARPKVYSCSRHSKKWWMCILECLWFYFGLDVAVVNAHINCSARYTLLSKNNAKKFHIELAKELQSMHSVHKISGTRAVVVSHSPDPCMLTSIFQSEATRMVHDVSFGKWRRAWVWTTQARPLMLYRTYDRTTLVDEARKAVAL